MTATKRPFFLAKDQRTRDWKKQKRRELDNVLRAYKEFRLGCAFLPGYKDYQQIIDSSLTAWREELSVKKWGR